MMEKLPNKGKDFLQFFFTLLSVFIVKKQRKIAVYFGIFDKLSHGKMFSL